MITSPRAAYVDTSPVHGRGVFAATAIAVGDVIELCPVLRLPAVQRDQIDATLLFEYYFDWDGDAGVAFGYGSLYNHSDEPNAEYIKHYDADLLEVRALRDVAAGEEITFSYTGTQGVDAAKPGTQNVDRLRIAELTE